MNSILVFQFSPFFKIVAFLLCFQLMKVTSCHLESVGVHFESVRVAVAESSPLFRVSAVFQETGWALSA